MTYMLQIESDNLLYMTYSPPLPYHLDRMVIAKYLLKKRTRVLIDLDLNIYSEYLSKDSLILSKGKVSLESLPNINYN